MTGRWGSSTREAGRMWIRAAGDGGTGVRRIFDPPCGSGLSPTDSAHPGLAPGATHVRPALRVAPRGTDGTNRRGDGERITAEGSEGAGDFICH